MSRHERRYQQHLARERAKRTLKTAEAFARYSPLVANFPIDQSLAPPNLFEIGIGNLVISRSVTDWRVAVAVFLVDVFCLGVKDVFFSILARDEYAMRLRGWRTTQTLQPIDPACLRKLVEGSVAYARNLGFNPAAGYEVARQIFGDLQATACPISFEYGHDGKPFYVSGPHETAARVQTILEKLQRLGPGNFDYLVAAQGSPSPE